jgi:pyruvate-formate lyase
MYLYNNLSGSLNYGRIDDYLGDLYVKDIAEGRLTKEEAIELLSSLWQIMEDRGWRYDQRMIIGGKGRKNEENADRLALIIMETSRQVKGIVPQLALRFYEGQNPELYQKALDVLGEGYTYPMLYNDDVNIPAVMEAFEVPHEEAIHAIQFGCGEYILNHRSFGTPSGVINLLQALLLTLHKGIDPVTGEPMGLPQKEFDKYNNFASFDDLYNAYKEQVEYHVEQLALHEELEYIYAAKDAPYLYFSMLYDDCIEEGEAIFSGGVRYLGGTLESYGNTNAADSLVAIRELVYEKEKFTLDEVVKMLDANFEDYEKERNMMLDCPKYGNDNNVADQMLVEIDRHVCEYTRKQKENTNLHSYLIVIINNDANVVMGRNTPASPDGRKAFNYLNNGNAPMSGRDQNGVTAFLNSIVKPDPTIHAGAVQNMKFSREMFTKYRNKLEILLKTYWEKGGTQAMLTVIGREDLENAMENPEKYQHLVVRVGGFAERFVDLPRETQQEILERTLY